MRCSPTWPGPPRLGAIALIALASNVYGLVLTGMEHSLQITLVALIMLPYCASADAPARPGGVRAELPAYAYAALLALPLVRYEGLAISVPLLLLSAYRGAWRKSGCALAAIGLAVAGFSLFLHSKGLGWLPSSILRKAGPVSVHSLLQNAWNNFAADIFLAPLVVCLLVYYWRRDRAWFGAILLATVLQYCLGSNGWFGRYEAYFVLFAVLLATRAVLCAGRVLFPYMLALPFFFPYLAIYTLLTPLGSSNIYNQQAQMAALAIAVGEPVAVNDLGLVSLRSPYYVLDLWGLGSMQALQHHLKGDGPAWMSALMARKQVRYAFVYDAWIAPRPAGWIRVGSLLLQQPRVLLSSPVVALYAVDAESAVKLRQVLSEAARRNTSRARSISVN